MNAEMMVAAKVNRRRRRKFNDRRWLVFRSEFSARAIRRRISRAKITAQKEFDKDFRSRITTPDLKTNSRWTRFKEKIIKKAKTIWQTISTRNWIKTS